MRRRRHGQASRLRIHLLTLLSLAAFAAVGAALSLAAPKVVAPGSQAHSVHRIVAYDAADTPVTDEGFRTQPISMRQTCTKCHSYPIVQTGLHFNYADRGDPGRPGEPFILTDAATGTQLPLSYRPWAGTWNPRSLGITDWTMVKTFGAMLPGGGIGEPASIDLSAAGPDRRWPITGPLEINCMACHSGDPQFDRIAWARQIAAENFRWAATASTGMAEVVGQVANLPLNYDFYRGVDPDDPLKMPPRVRYNHGLFTSKNAAFFDIPKRPLNDRCWACHSSRIVPSPGEADWHADTDVHMAAGMACVDCHRNGLAHDMVRGYEGERRSPPDTHRAPLTCAGCHLGEADAALAGRIAGRLGAPKPRHAGIPPIHLEKLSCTACHSGPWPGDLTRRVQTSRAHGLGLAGEESGPDRLPLIAEPVFAPGHDGKLTPHRALWPAFWARIEADGSLTPLLPKQVYLTVVNTPQTLPVEGQAEPRPLTADERVASVLARLGEDLDGGDFAYIRAGKAVRLQEGRLLTFDHPAAAATLWPVAHDVRPAGHSLGVRGCDDCHRMDSPLLFGAARAEAPAGFGPQDATVPMLAMTRLDGQFHRGFAWSFGFRPSLKIFGFASAAVVAWVLMANLVAGLCGIFGRASDGRGGGRP